MTFLSWKTPQRTTAQRGAHAEQAACRYLEQRGLRLLERNYRCRGGEIDLVMQDADNLVFVEVRYRRQTAYGSGLESVTRHKQARISRCAALYLQRHPAQARRAARFDVIALAPAANGSALGGFEIEWIRAAFDAF